RRLKPQKYYAFDLLWHDDTDLRMLPQQERRKKLKRILPKNKNVIEESLAVKGALGPKFFELMCELDLEGVIAKRPQDPYAKRTKWYKVKNPNYSQAKGRGSSKRTA